MKNSVRIIILTTAKYTPTQLWLTGSLSPKTKRDAPRTEVNTKTEKKKNSIAMYANNIERPLVAWNFRCGI